MQLSRTAAEKFITPLLPSFLPIDILEIIAKMLEVDKIPIIILIRYDWIKILEERLIATYMTPTPTRIISAYDILRELHEEFALCVELNRLEMLKLFSKIFTFTLPIIFLSVEAMKRSKLEILDWLCFKYEHLITQDVVNYSASFAPPVFNIFAYRFLGTYRINGEAYCHALMAGQSMNVKVLLEAGIEVYIPILIKSLRNPFISPTVAEQLWELCTDERKYSLLVDDIHPVHRNINIRKK